MNLNLVPHCAFLNDLCCFRQAHEYAPASVVELKKLLQPKSPAKVPPKKTPVAGLQSDLDDFRVGLHSRSGLLHLRTHSDSICRPQDRRMPQIEPLAICV